MNSVTVSPSGVVGTASAAPLVAALLLGIQPATVPSWVAFNPELRREVIGTRSAVLELLPPRTAAEGTAVLDDAAAPLSEDTNRTTTEAERVIGELREWTFLNTDWDGEGAAVPNPASIADAVAFVQVLSPDLPIPEPMLHASGLAGLFWNAPGLYADLEFWGEGKLTYYIERNGTKKHKGVVDDFTGEALPRFLAALLA